MKKRLLAVLLAGVMGVSILAGCGGGNGAEKSTSKSTATSTSSKKEATGDSYKVTLLMSQRDEFLSALESAANAAVPSNVKLDVQDAQSDAAKQLQQLEAAKNAGANAIIVNMVDPETAASLIASAGDVPIVFVNRYPSDDSVLDAKHVYVGSDENTSGKFQGDFLAEKFKAEGKTEIKYVLMNGILGQTSTTLRTKSVLKALEDGGIKATEATAPLACDYDRAKAIDKFSPLVGTVDYDCIISNNDAMAIGCIEALEQKGKDPKEKPIVGIDATADGRQAIKDGKLSMSVFQNPTGQGAGSLQAAVNLIEGKDLAEGTGYEKDSTGFVLWVPFEPVTPDNVSDYDGK